MARLYMVVRTEAAKEIAKDETISRDETFVSTKHSLLSTDSSNLSPALLNLITNTHGGAIFGASDGGKSAREYLAQHSSH